MSEETEAELMHKVSTGDHAAYRTILERQLPSLSRYVIRMTGTLGEAEDITQEVFLRLWTHADRFDPGVSRLSTWLHNIAHNLVIDHFRKQARLVNQENDDVMESDSDPALETQSVATAEAVKAALMMIPERQRSAVVMCHYQGLSNKEAADVMDVSVDALESLLARGRRNLKRLLSLDE